MARSTPSPAATLALLLSMSLLFGRVAHASDIDTALDLVRDGQAAEAVAIFRELAEAGDSTAQVNLAVMHARGEGVPLDDVEAGYWAWRARLMGDRRAALQSDMLLARLPKGARNALATRLSGDFETLARSGQSQAFVALGRLETEVRQPPKPQSAAVWLTLAAAFEVPFARTLRDAASAALSDAARLKVQSQAREAFAEWCVAVPEGTAPASCPGARTASMAETN
ncbi:MAG: hypothetical protein AAGA15_00480 [Pseudomonadota bacterium]